MADEKVETCRDALGNELKVGDKVAWGARTKHGGLRIGTVQVRNDRAVKVRRDDSRWAGWQLSVYVVRLPGPNEAVTEDHVLVTKDHLKSLEEDAEKLAALEGAGVDNWQGYDTAMDILREMREEDEE